MPYPVWVKFCSLVGIANLITCANFGGDQLRATGVVGDQILPFPIGFPPIHRSSELKDLRHRPYNTLALSASV